MIASDSVIHLGITFNRKFLTPFYVLSASIFENNKEVCIHMHIVTPDLTEDDKVELVTYYVNAHAGKVSFHQPDPAQISKLPPSSWYPPVGFYRLFLAEMLQHSGIEKIIYLDTDIVVIGSLLELYNQSTNGYPVGVVVERNATKIRPDLGLLQEYTFFNSGVMLINIPEWIRQAVTDKTLNYLFAHPKLPTADQDALNVVLEGNYMPLDGKFNVLPQDIPANLPSKKYAAFLKDKVVIHYAAHWKPWDITANHKLRYLYFDYMKLSQRPNEPRYQPFRLTPRVIYTFVRVRVKEWLNNYPVLFRLADFLYRRTLSR